MEAKFQNYTCVEDYLEDGLDFLTPMTAQEITGEEAQDAYLKDFNYYVEEKLDGTRGTLFILEDCMRVFSRRVSKKTGWFCENTDSVPHIRDFLDQQISIFGKNLAGTVLDGEMYIPNRPFRDISATLNCKWDKAVVRQKELGKVYIRVFDIRYFKGICLENMSLQRRKFYLKRVVEALGSPYVIMHPYYDDRVPFTEEMNNHVNEYVGELSVDFPHLADDLYYESEDPFTISKAGFYEYIVMCGGEGVMVKDKKGKYHEKRGKEYLKIKKFLTRDVVITGYSPATKEYTGKFPKNYWPYWVDENDNRFDCLTGSVHSKASDLVKEGNTPVTHFWWKYQIGTVKFSVKITKKELVEVMKKKDVKFEVIDIDGELWLEVGECAGFDDEIREYISKNQDECDFKVIEVKCNEVFRDTGKMRHPRFVRFRDDKNADDCTWKDHISVVSNYVIED